MGILFRYMHRLLRIFGIIILLNLQPPQTTISAETKNPLQIQYTTEEKAWLQSHHEFTVGIMENWPPITLKGTDGNPTGIDVDIIKVLSEQTGLYTTVTSGQFEDILNAVKNKQLDALMGVTPNAERKKYINFTDPYLIIPHVIIARRDDDTYFSSEDQLKGKKLALERGFVINNYFRENYPDVHIVNYESTAECLDAVSRGNADAYAGNRAVGIYIISQKLFTNLEVQATLNKKGSVLAIGIRKDWPELTAILNKALKRMAPNEKQAILLKWVGIDNLQEKRQPYDKSPLPQPADFDRMSSLMKNIAIAILFILVAVIFIWFLRGRPKQFSIRETLLLISVTFAGLIVIIGIFVYRLTGIEAYSSKIEALKYDSFNLALELKQSSDDLTRFARTYTVTGDPKYEQYFRDILAIRDGNRAHPYSSDRAYWDHVTAGAVVLDDRGEKYSIEKRMLELGISEEEQKKLAEAKKESDDLTNLENIAMNAVKGIYKDAEGNFTIKGEPDLAMARNLVHGTAYHEAKSRIMKPIDDFFNLLERRTSNELVVIHERARTIILTVTVLIFITIGYAIYVFFLLKRRIIQPLSLLENGAGKIKAGDYSHKIDIFSKDEVGALALAFNSMTNSIEKHTTELKEAQAHFQGLLEAAPDGFIVVDENGVIVLVNAQTEKMFGYTKDQMIGNQIEMLLPPDLRQKHVSLRKQYDPHSTETPKNQGPDFFACRADGKLMPVEISLSPIKTNQGELIVASIRDITDRKRAEEEVRKLSRAVEQSPVSVVITDPTGNIEYVNPKFCEITGYRAEEAIGKNPRIIKSGENPSELYRELWETITAGNEWRGEFLNRKKDGELFWEMASITSIKSNDESIACYLAVKEDITERKEIEKDLYNAKVAAEEAARSKSDFLANMSHEIRTPMNAIIGMSHLILKTDLNAKQLDYLQKIDMSAKSLLGIINDILDFSKIEAGRLDMESTRFQLEDVLNNLANLVGAKAQEKKLEFLFNVDPKVPTSLVGDPLRLGQILINLTNNAVKFTESGEIIISITPVENSGSKIKLRFSVQDSGIGLSEEQQSKLFQAFSQADTSTTRKYGGTGLGLTISKKLSEMMDGEIGVKSSLGKGSTFFFTAVFGLYNEIRTPLLPEPDLRGKRALIVDDHQVSREIMNVMLQGMTFDVSQAASGEEALLEVARADDAGKSYHVIYMDWQMPGGMDGITSSKRIKALDLTLQPKIIMVTAHGREEIMKQADDIGLDGFLLKPVSRSMLFDVTMQAFGREGTRPHKTRNRAKEIDVLEDIRDAMILLAEDNEINQQVAQEILKGGGFFVDIANNGKEAVEMVQRKKYDAVLMDIQMPVLDGKAATRSIREQDRFKDLPIIAMTAHAMSGDKEKSLAAGMNDHITKPIDPDELFSTLLRWIKPVHRKIPEELESTDITYQKTETSTVFLPDSLPGINMKEGLKRIRNNKKLYNDMLLEFKNNYPKTAEEIKTLFSDGKPEDARRLAHTIKGVAGNLGANSLQDASLVLEMALQDQTLPDEALADFTDAMFLVMDSLAAIREEPKPDEQVSEGKTPRAELAEAIKALLPSLKKRKPKPCRECMDSLKRLGWPASHIEDVSQLDQLVNKYKFNEALALAENMLESLKG